MRGWRGLLGAVAVVGAMAACGGSTTAAGGGGGTNGTGGGDTTTTTASTTETSASLVGTWSGTATDADASWVTYPRKLVLSGGATSGNAHYERSDKEATTSSDRPGCDSKRTFEGTFTAAGGNLTFTWASGTSATTGCTDTGLNKAETALSSDGLVNDTAKEIDGAYTLTQTTLSLRGGTITLTRN